MLFEVKTPALKQSVDAALAVISGLQDGTLEPKTAAGIVSAARTVQSGVKTEITARLSAPKIAAMEAKIVEQSKQKQIEDKAA